jgi:hypothetical protein
MLSRMILGIRQWLEVLSSAKNSGHSGSLIPTVQRVVCCDDGELHMLSRDSSATSQAFHTGDGSPMGKTLQYTETSSMISRNRFRAKQFFVTRVGLTNM